MRHLNLSALATAAGASFLFACTPPSDDSSKDVPSEEEEETDPGLEILGGNTHSPDGVALSEVIGSDTVSRPMDLAFHPTNPGQLWIVNQTNHSMSIISDADTDNWSDESVSHPTGAHFMVQPAGLAFGDNGNLATIHEEDETTPYTEGAPGTFMGPTMWPSDTDTFDGGHSSHLDMLHNSPNGVGIAWEDENIYWIFDGYHASLTRYDFADDHGGGGADHSDGEVLRYVEGEVGYEPGVSSNLVFDPGSNLLYVADSGNGRIAVLDTTSGSTGGAVYPNYDWSTQYQIDDADLWTLVDGDTAGLQIPSGLALHDEMIFVVDHATSFIWAFDLEGEVVDWLETGIEPYSLMGIDFDAEGRLYVADAQADRVMRISAL